MSLSLGIAVFFLVWWVILFAVLPFGVRTQADAGDIVPGTPESAPAKFRIRRVLLINTCVACVVFGLIWLIIEFDVLGIAALEGATPI